MTYRYTSLRKEGGRDGEREREIHQTLESDVRYIMCFFIVPGSRQRRTNELLLLQISRSHPYHRLEWCHKEMPSQHFWDVVT